MKKAKKQLLLSSTSLILCASFLMHPYNMVTANAGIMRYPINEQYYNQQTPEITGNYQQRLSFKTRKSSHKPYASVMLETIDGKLQMRIVTPVNDGYRFDDVYLVAVVDKYSNVRFKYLTSFEPKSTAQAELENLVYEFNKLGAGLGDRIIVAGRDWNGTVIYDTSGETSALLRTGFNNFNKGYTNKETKYYTSLEIKNEGLQEVNTRWGSDHSFSNVF